MNLMELAQLLGSFGEFVGAIGVVATLAYLAVQVRQNTRSTRASTYSDASGGWQDYMQGQSVEDLDLLLQLSIDPEQLSNAQFLRAYYLCRAMFRRMEHDYYQYQADTFDEATWLAYVRAFTQDTFSAPGLRVMWKLQSGFFNPAFAAFMSKVVEEMPKQPPRVKSRFSELLLAER